MEGLENQFFFSEENFLLVARSFFRQEDLRNLREKIMKRFGEVFTEVMNPRRAMADELGIAQDETRLHQDYYEIWKHAALERLSPLLPRFDKVIFPPQVRIVRDRKSFVPWHQDEAYMLALGPLGHREVLTVFLPLNDRPREYPSVEFICNANQQAVNHITRPGFLLNSFDVPDYEMMKSSECLSPELELGDVFVFGKHVMHRTRHAKEIFEPRLSMEFRLTTDQALISGKDYYDLKTQDFFLKE